jgi:hypothetical protein
MGTGYTLQRLDDLPALLLTFHREFEFQRDARRIVDELTALLEASPGPVFDITDAREMDLNFTDLVMGLQLVTRGVFSNDRPLLKHPNLREIVVVAAHRLTEAAGQALQQVHYGGHQVRIFRTLDEALAYVREKSQPYPD